MTENPRGTGTERSNRSVHGLLTTSEELHILWCQCCFSHHSEVRFVTGSFLFFKLHSETKTVVRKSIFLLFPSLSWRHLLSNTTGPVWLPPASDTSTRAWPSTTISSLLAGIGEVLDRRLVTLRLVSNTTSQKHRNFVAEPMGRSVINVTSDESTGLDYEQLQESYRQHHHHHHHYTTTTTTSVSLQVGWLESLL